MAGKPAPQEKIDEAVRLYSSMKSTIKVAKAMRLSDSTVNRYLDRAGVVMDGHLKIGVAPAESPPAPILPEFPDEDVPVENIIDHMAKRFEKRKASHEAHTWFPIQIKDKKPIGLFWFGDPHLDDNGCNWTVLKRDIELCKNTEGLYGVNIGDTTNNWAGRLVKLYANQDTSVKTARRLAEWFLMKSGVSWLVILLGNHDVWGDGAEIIAQMVKRHGTHKVVCHDWEARFCLSFANGWQPRIYAAHDFPGHSQWNPLHGPMKAGQMGDEAELFVCGHKHNAAFFEFENAARGLFQRFVRVRGYKFLDDYARRLGITEQTTGCSAVTVFDPETRKITVFSDVEEGAAYLAFKRARA
jgi:hypothetical protein